MDYVYSCFIGNFRGIVFVSGYEFAVYSSYKEREKVVHFLYDIVDGFTFVPVQCNSIDSYHDC